ncbi:PAP/OAS1 substrate-binding domain-containing protein [Amniculicola lignicola CBS 123094]|uniref:polynucleotide adenylyltransferase n=1 Tax=Amniculicola lignicola CBS 123094 TaxID=1392246 RepID=A0A6A5WZ34_9PLEO|nr:PAP/OAS1 substrate-binding domain-containing protein [Amniculicola lignicola CBS 123094]
MLQTEYLERIAKREIPKVEITLEEVEALETFRKHLDDICQKAFTEGYSGDIVVFSLLGFGSLASGFAMPGSDMDLAIVPGWKDPSKIDTPLDKEIPRLFEKAILEANLGARLLTRARVPILKVCQTPSDQLYTALYEERKKWDGLPEEEKWEDFVSPDTSLSQKPLVDLGGDNKTPSMPQQNGHGGSGTDKHLTVDVEASKQSTADNKKSPRPRKPKTPKAATPKETSDNNPDSNTRNSEAKGDSNNHVNNVQKRGPWLREKVLGPLDFPKHGIGIQCDVNFGNPLGLHNTSLLRCYSMCDPRVRPIVLFIKAWAKRRKINSSYSGTLSSYGWVLMALHYLVNIASPPVLPNLQLAWRPPPEISGMTKALQDTMVQGYEVRFWRNEDEIRKSAREGKLTTNNQTVGELLRGFFHYYASPPPNYGPRQPSFFWTQEVLSLRTLGGIRTKQDKSWTGANTTIKNGKEIRNRYLFAIEDPFELDHNVARTVTHNGIVAIRDEFRRAWRIVTAVGRDVRPEGDLFDEIIEVVPPPSPTPTAASAQASNQASGETQAKNEASTEDMEIFATAEEAADAMARHEQENFEQDIGRNDPHGKTVPYPGLALH